MVLVLVLLTKLDGASIETVNDQSWLTAFLLGLVLSRTISCRVVSLAAFLAPHAVCILGFFVCLADEEFTFSTS